jgi:hypothetical protein
MKIQSPINHPNLIISFVLLLALSLMLGCLGKPATQGSAPKPKAPQSNTYKPARLLIQNEPRGNTGVYQQHLKLSSPLFIDGKLADEEHAFEVNNTASYKGKTPTCVSEHLAFMITHTTPTKAGWHYPSKASISVIADGQTLKPVKVVQQAPEIEDGEYWETLIVQPTCEMFSSLGKAASAEIQIGNASIKVSSDELNDLKKFAEAIGYRQ